MFKSFLLLDLFVFFCVFALPTYDLTDPSNCLLKGRYLVTENRTVKADIELFSLSFIVENATAIQLLLRDNTFGGARLGVTLDTRVESSFGGGDPNPSGSAMPGLRVSTLLTSSLVDTYNLGSGGQIHGLTLIVTVTLLSEWEMIKSKFGEELEFLGISTDGRLLPPPSRPTRRLAILGDSLSSGVGPGFDVPSGVSCGAGVPIDDVEKTWGALLCANFTAECEVVAASGITITADTTYNLPLVFPWSLGAMSGSDWPAASRVPWSTRAHPVDAVLIELGENDCHAFNCSSPKSLQRLATAYVQFVTILATQFYTRVTPFFLTIANHEAGQSGAMLSAIPSLLQEGFNVTFLNATSPDSLDGVNINTGCAGHPSYLQNIVSFSRAQKTLASALGW